MDYLPTCEWNFSLAPRLLRFCGASTCYVPSAGFVSNLENEACAKEVEVLPLFRSCCATHGTEEEHHFSGAAGSTKKAAKSAFRLVLYFEASLINLTGSTGKDNLDNPPDSRGNSRCA